MRFVGVVREGDGKQVSGPLAVQLTDAHAIRQGVDAVRRVPGRVGNGDLDVAGVPVDVPFGDGHDPGVEVDAVFGVHHLHQLARHEVVPAEAGFPVQVHRLGRVADIRVFVALQHLLRPRLQRGRVLDAGVGPHAALHAPGADGAGVDVGHAIVGLFDRQLVHALAIAQRVKASDQRRGVHALVDAHQVAPVVDAAAGCGVRPLQAHRPGRSVGVKLPGVFVRQHLAQAQQRGKQAHILEVILELVGKIHRAQLPPPRRLPVQYVLHHVPGVDAGAAHLMVAEQHVVQQRGHHVLQAVGFHATQAGFLAAGHPHDAEKPRISRPVRQLHQVVRLAEAVFRVVGRQGKGPGPQVVMLQLIADFVGAVQNRQHLHILVVYGQVFQCSPPPPCAGRDRGPRGAAAKGQADIDGIVPIVDHVGLEGRGIGQRVAAADLGPGWRL